jgi:DNA-binding transcriptional regulator YiaG
MKNTTSKKKKHTSPSKNTDWVYWMQAIEPSSQKINEAFPGNHPLWVVQSQTEISAERFCYLRKHVLRINQAQCAAYLRVDMRTIRRWENGEVDIPFASFELLRVVYHSAQFKLSHPEWDGWFISTTGELISPYCRDIALTPGDLNLVPYLHSWNATMKDEVAKLTQELAVVRAENTALRELFLANGITDEVAAMQERVNALMTRINTARVIPFAPVQDEPQLQEKIA